MTNAPKEFTEFVVIARDRGHFKEVQRAMETSVGLFTGHAVRPLIYATEWPDKSVAPPGNQSSMRLFKVVRTSPDEAEKVERSLRFCEPAIRIIGSQQVEKVEMVLGGTLCAEHVWTNIESALQPIFIASVLNNAPPNVCFTNTPPELERTPSYDCVSDWTTREGLAFFRAINNAVQQIKYASRDELSKVQAGTVRKSVSAIQEIARAEILKARQVFLLRHKLLSTF